MAETLPAASDQAELVQKLARLREVARRHGLRQMVLHDSANPAWLLGGRVHVVQAIDTACMAAIVKFTVDQTVAEAVTSTIEAPRLGIGRRRQAGR